MKVFVTGATGFIGSATVSLLLKDGHQVTGMARSDEGVRKLEEKGVTGVKADLSSLDTIKAEAAKADAVIHLAYIHDFSRYEQSLQTELQVLAAFIDALEASNKPLIMTSGTALLGNRQDVPDESALPDTAHAGRGDAEAVALKGVQRGVNVSVVRLPVYVYDKTGAAFTKVQEAKAKELGKAVYIATGTQTVCVVNVVDAAQAYVNAITHAKPGKAYHTVSGTVTAKEVAEGIAAKHGLPVKEVTSEEAVKLYGPFFSRFFGMNNVVDSQKTRAELQWSPVHGRSYFLDCIAGKAA